MTARHQPRRLPRVRATTAAPALSWCLTCPQTCWLGENSVRLARAHVKQTGHRCVGHMLVMIEVDPAQWMVDAPVQAEDCEP